MVHFSRALKFVGLMKGATLEHAQRASGRIAGLPLTAVERAELQAALYFLSSFGLDRVSVFGIISEEVLMQSPAYQATIEKGRVEGRVEEARRLLGRQVARRLGGEAPAPLREAIDSCRDLARLERVADLVVDTSGEGLVREALVALRPEAGEGE